ncbi:MAG: hypothetical protein SPG60_06830 [Eubacterium coprostanoligenes]|nr:hypothetical protein [Eubacterium coprostanoligenes]
MIKEKLFNKEITSYCILAVISIMCVTLFCKSSPIYPICDLPDANTWLIQAKQVLSGLVPYKDIYEHKGPLQIFAYLFAALPCFNRFEGLYITELVLFIIYSIGVYKTSKLFGEKYNLLATIISIFVVSLSSAFSATGSSEELLLSTFIWSVYFMVKNIQRNQIFKPFDVLLIGAFCAIRLWTKYNLCFFDVILVVYVLAYYIKNKWNIWKTILYYILGFACVTVPLLIYFAVKGALYDLFYVYFYIVIFKYYTAVGSIHNYNTFIIKALTVMPVILCMLPNIIDIRSKNRKKEDVFYLITFFLFFIYIVYSSTWWSYYFLDLFAFLIFFVTKSLNNKPKFSLPILIVVIASMFVINSSQIETFKFDKSEYKQFEIAEIVNSVDNPKLYYYQAENGGFYIYSDTMPFTRYFTNYNINAEEVADERQQVIENKEADFLLTIQQNDFDGYTLVKETQIPNWDVVFDEKFNKGYKQYYLYEKAENLK